MTISPDEKEFIRNLPKRVGDSPAERLAQARREPVPPAGDVQVLAHIDIFTDSKVGLTDAGLRMALAGLDDVELVDRAHVTRLTAERDRHAHNSKEWESASLHWMAEYDKSQSELTKAQELLGKLERAGLRTKAQGIEVRAYLAHQSAPVAKGACCEHFPKCVHGEGADGL